ncbi:MAG: cupin domain-containing protein [Candidatus Omnitrophica bacterium]|nr:cupin domain-containing protein [Candidatus Omnitrophota bacterium]MDD5592287.1 cupin domain-containing protein [Candidatus Omnitrophota bacterium]
MKNIGPFVKKLDGRKKFKRIFGKSGKKKGLSSGFMTIKKGDTVGIHNTGGKEEVLVVLHGKAQVSIANKHFILKDGIVLYIPPDTLHDVKNIGTRLLKYLYVTAAV